MILGVDEIIELIIQLLAMLSRWHLGWQHGKTSSTALAMLDHLQPTQYRYQADVDYHLST